MTAPSTPPKLRPKVKVFVREYAKDLNGTQAAIRAGYSVRTAGAIASEHLQKPHVQAAIQAEQAARAKRLEITADAVVREFAILGLADMRNYLRFDDKGQVYLDWANMPETATKAIAEITQEEYVEGKDEDARVIRKTKFKLHDKVRALENLGKHLGLFPKEPSGGTPPVQDNRTQVFLLVLQDPEARAAAIALSRRIAIAGEGKGDETPAKSSSEVRNRPEGK